MKYFFLILILFTVLALNAQQPTCDELFMVGEYDQVVVNCKDKLDKTDYQRFQFNTAQLFSKVSPQRVEEIFYYGHMLSKLFYEYKTGKKLNSNIEKYYIDEAFKSIKPLNIKNRPDAQLLIAKLYYISEKVLKPSDNYSSDRTDRHSEKQDFEKYFIANVKSAADADNDNTMANYLLGKESVEPKHVEGDPNGVFYVVKNKKLFPYLQKAAAQENEFAQMWMTGIKNWNAHLKKLNSSADAGSPDALYKLGMDALLEANDEHEDLIKALNYFEKAYANGHQPSLKWMSNIYQRLNMSDKFVESLHGLSKQNNADAMLKLGDYYFCLHDKQKAKEWYLKAKANNNALAQYALDDLKTAHLPYEGCRYF